MTRGRYDEAWRLTTRRTCADMHDVRRLARMLERAVSAPPTAPPSNVIPLARYLRPASQYALPLASGARRDPGDER